MKEIPSIPPVPAISRETVRSLAKDLLRRDSRAPAAGAIYVHDLERRLTGEQVIALRPIPRAPRKG